MSYGVTVHTSMYYCAMYMVNTLNTHCIDIDKLKVNNQLTGACSLIVMINI